MAGQQRGLAHFDANQANLKRHTIGQHESETLAAGWMRERIPFTEISSKIVSKSSE
jgi:hypothetical protein